MWRFLFSLFIFLGGTFFGKTLLLEGAALCFRGFLSLCYDIDASYEKLDWREGHLCIDCVHLRQEKKWEADLPHVSIAPFSRRIDLKAPYLTVHEFSKWQGRGSWKFSVENGTLFKEGIGEVHFSCERNWPHQMGRFILEKGAMRCEGEAIFEGQEISLYCNCEHLDLSLFKEWFDGEGRVEGWVHSVFQEGVWKRGRAHLQCINGGLNREFCGIAGEIDWEGDAVAEFAKTNRLRLRIEEGSWRGIQHFHGELSFAADVGARWECSAEGHVPGELFPLSCKGKAFLQGPRWGEALFLIDRAPLSFRCEGEEWNVEIEGAGAKETALLQSLLFSAEERWTQLCQIKVDELFLNLQGKGRGKEWTVELAASDVKMAAFECDSAALLFSSEQEGSFSYSGASFRFAGLEGEKWNGSGTLQQGIRLNLEGQGEIARRSLHVCLGGVWKDGGWVVEKTSGELEEISFQGSGWIGGSRDWFWQGNGELPGGFSFFCPLVTSLQGEAPSFDLHISKGVVEAARISGSFARFDLQHSHLFGFPLLSEERLSAALPLQELCPLIPLLFPANNSPIPCLEGEAILSLSLTEGEKFLTLSADSFFWKKEEKVIAQGKMAGGISFDKKQFELSVADFSCDLGGLSSNALEGRVEGNGCLSWKEQWEADFDLTPGLVRWRDVEWENQGAVHFALDARGMLLCTGIDLQALESDTHLQANLVECDIHSGVCKGKGCRIYLPPQSLPWGSKRGFDLTADVEWASDLPIHFFCNSAAGNLPWGEELYPFQDLFFCYEEGDVGLSFSWLHPAMTIPVQITASLCEEKRWAGQIRIGEGEERLSFHGDYLLPDQFSIEAIEGRFGGLEAAFCRTGSDAPLLGGARVDWARLSPLLPARLAEIVQKLQMGSGYELRGKLAFSPFVFEGILRGKELGLFGYQLRTLLGHINFSDEQVKLSDLKISDAAGVLKIDTLLAQKSKRDWLLSIPSLTLLELRPSLLHPPGVEAPPVESAGPLVVRELKLTRLEGSLEDAKSFKGNGSLYFINSYRREHTVFDIPSDLLGRIVGLDLELLIPVRGSLRFLLHEGLFRLLELEGAYSEAQRSEFSLVPDPLPMMDLDGNLRIFVQMKQFVLFKFTESLWISIDGTLTKPNFHLRKKLVSN
ncbi:MAG: hypothetical protein KGI80_04030 [Verrucomicrobiota bacterium]|nr:hypothetical protein [Verrucomicrobiota bacterium]